MADMSVEAYGRLPAVVTLDDLAAMNDMANAARLAVESTHHAAGVIRTLAGVATEIGGIAEADLDGANWRPIVSGLGEGENVRVVLDE